MNAYAPQTPRFAIALAAFALSALTIGTMVVAPAQFDEGFAPTDTVLAARPAAGPVEVAIVPARIEVVAVREPVEVVAMRASERCRRAGTGGRGRAGAERRVGDGRSFAAQLQARRLIRRTRARRRRRPERGGRPARRAVARYWTSGNATAMSYACAARSLPSSCR